MMFFGMPWNFAQVIHIYLSFLSKHDNLFQLVLNRISLSVAEKNAFYVVVFDPRFTAGRKLLDCLASQLPCNQQNNES